MTDLADFLLARIAEDEAVARRAADNAGHFGVPDHVVRYSPKRVLAECEAKRRIVEMHRAGEHDCPGINHPGIDWIDDEDCPTLRALALPYADHPDYRGEWGPAQ